MKGLKTAAGTVVVCLLCMLSSCGGASAEKLVRGWDEAALNLYRYSGRELDCGGDAAYILVMTPERDLFTSDEAVREYQEYETVRQCVEGVYRELRECFAAREGEVRIIIVVCGCDGRPEFTFLNGETVEETGQEDADSSFL